LLETHRKLVRAELARFGGTEIRPSAMLSARVRQRQNAVALLVAVQDAHAAHNAGIDAARAIHMRAGVHLGDVERRGGDIFGSGVNIAARLEPVAPVDGIAISEVVISRCAAARSRLRIARPAGTEEHRRADGGVRVVPRSGAHCRGAREVGSDEQAEPASWPLRFLSELRRRKVIQTLLLYVARDWRIQQGAAYLCRY
jgi:class 3 adenylate cyclase